MEDDSLKVFIEIIHLGTLSAFTETFAEYQILYPPLRDAHSLILDLSFCPQQSIPNKLVNDDGDDDDTIFVFLSLSSL